MLEELNKQIKEVEEKILDYTKTQSTLESYRKRQRELQDKKYTLERALMREKIDVERLEETSLKKLLLKLFKNYEDELLKEKNDVIAAQLRYNECLEELKCLQTEISQIQKSHIGKEDPRKRYEQLYAEKKKYLAQSDEAFGVKLLELDNKISTSKRQLREVNEAIYAGENVIRALNAAWESLSKAENWGTFDLLGGGLIADLAKHSHIDDASGQIAQVKMHMTKFKSELRDVKMTLETGIQISGFEKMGDFIFDGLLFDGLVQSKIYRSQGEIKRVGNEANQVISRLRNLKRNIENDLKVQEYELNQFVVNK